MRELTKTDVVMLDNTMRLLKQVVARGADFDEMLGAAQTWNWINKFRSEVASHIIEAEKERQLELALASAKEVTPAKVKGTK